MMMNILFYNRSEDVKNAKIKHILFNLQELYNILKIFELY